jgi:hypothetical protein
MLPAFPAAGTIIERFAALVLRVAGHVGTRTRQVPAFPPGYRLIPPAFCALVQDWLFARQRAIIALMRHFEAGTLRTARVYAPRTVKAGASLPAARPALPPEKVLPRGLGWLCRWAPETRRTGAEIAELLHDPKMQEMVLAAPGRMVRLLGPLLTATGEARPAWFPRPAKPAGRRRSPACRPRAGSPRSAWEAPLIPLPQPVYPAPAPPRPKMAPWTGRGPGPCATLAEYRSPFEPPGGEYRHAPPPPPEPPEWQTRLIQRKRQLRP